MSENNRKQFQDCRFQTTLELNGNMICQRYFDITNFNPKSLSSIELKKAIARNVQVIKNDLVSKTRIALSYIYDEEHVSSKQGKTSYWYKLNDEFRNPLAKTNTFKYSFLMDGKVIISEEWDGSVYPSIVCSKIDITNKKFEFADTNVDALSPINKILKMMSAGKTDLNSEAIRNLCEVCSRLNKAYTKTTKTLPLSLEKAQEEIYEGYRSMANKRAKINNYRER